MWYLTYFYINNYKCKSFQTRIIKTYIPAMPSRYSCLMSCTSSIVLLCVRWGLSRRLQRWVLWLRPPSSSLSVVSCRVIRWRFLFRELIRWREPTIWSLNESQCRWIEVDAVQCMRVCVSHTPVVRVLDVCICIAVSLRMRLDTLLLTHESHIETHTHALIHSETCRCCTHLCAITLGVSSDHRSVLTALDTLHTGVLMRDERQDTLFHAKTWPF